MFRLTSRPVALITLFVFCATTFAIPGVASARWRDQSGDLPGMDSGSLTGYYVAGSVLVVGLAAILIVKHHKKSSKATSLELNRRESAPQAYALGCTADPTSRVRATGLGSATSFVSAEPSPFAGALRPLAIRQAAPVVSLAQMDASSGGKSGR
jgi:hypothetical protein